MREITSTGQAATSAAQRTTLALALSLLIAIVLATIVPEIKPDFFGSDFEGSSGYIAIFIFTPAVVLILTPILLFPLRNASRLAFLILWFLVQLVLGFFFFNLILGKWLGNALWLGGLIVLSRKIYQESRNRAL